MSSTASSIRDWSMLAFESDYKSVVAILDELRSGHFDEAIEGLQVLSESMSLSSQREMRSHLTNLMAHVIKWKTQPNRRSTSWIRSINNARVEIGEIREAVPSITEETIECYWEKCFAHAIKDAETEMQQDSDVVRLSWQEVFDDEYVIPRK